MKYIKTEIDSEEHFSKLKGPWIIANIDSWIAWPQKRTIVYYKNVKMYLFQEEEGLSACIGVIKTSSFNDDEIRKVIMQFVSELAWVEQNRINIVSWLGGSFPFREVKRSKLLSIVSSHFRVTYLPEIEDDKTRLALAFYREGLGLDHKAYSFLSFYKIINMFYKNGPAQKDWIKNNYSKMTESKAKERIDELAKSGIAIDEYLYVSCRCAIAHAGVEPTIDPENLEDNLRLSNDLPVIKNLVEMLIENELNVKTSRSIWKEHKYELMGFKEVIGNDTITKILNNEEIKEINLPQNISIRIWNKANYSPFEGMTIASAYYDDSILLLKYISKDSLITFYLKLDLKNERLLIDPMDEIKKKDDNTSNAAKNIYEVFRFFIDFLTNGSLEIWDNSTNSCLGFCVPFIPTNIDVGKTIENFEKIIKDYQNKANEREVSIKKA